MAKHNIGDVPIRQRNYSKKSCDCCGKWFKPSHPAQKYCCTECRDIMRKNMDTAYKKHICEVNKQKRREYNRAHRFCSVCGQPILNGHQNVHFDCMVDKWRMGDRSIQIKRYFWNRFYSLKEVDGLARGRSLWKHYTEAINTTSER